ncbi:alpha/beta hydrolase [Parasphingopyxis algicola]|uniref:alpha/beta fold hydrolase n=1 Tax=Parasphingopyxis algicola TaxID=2026624 RepID=UPI0015A3E6D7|nr:alpha/beta hydrolase [Parasphingopyxis algicola]QLC26495.1 alpha/beta hydrolase [Parasphingopyxis algicola]
MTYQSLWTDVHRSSFEQGFVDANGVRTRYIRAGDPDGPALIFLHGTGGHAEAFLRNLDAHAAHFNTYLIDYLGHGWTEKPEIDYEMPQYCQHLADTMDALGIEHASICGESMGGWIAAWFAIHYPDRVDRLILNTMGGATMNPEVMKTVYDKTLAAVESPATHTKPRLEWLMADPSVVTDDLVACRERIYSQPGMKEAIKRILCLQVEEPRRRNLMTEDNMSRIKAPTLVVWTSKDPTASTDVGKMIAGWIPGAQFTVMENCGHWPQYEKPDEYNAICLDFLLEDREKAAA